MSRSVADEIVEQATLTVADGRQAQFEAAFAEAGAVIGAADGFLGASLSQCVEEPTRYLLSVRWRDLAAHLDGFRNSPGFTRWRELVGPFFAAPPAVLHFSVKAHVDEP